MLAVDNVKARLKKAAYSAGVQIATTLIRKLTMLKPRTVTTPCKLLYGQHLKSLINYIIKAYYK